MTSGTETIEINNNRYTYYFTGNARKGTIFMLHGILGNHREFFPLMNLLSQDYRIYAFNLPGFGNSNSLEKFSMNTVVTDLEVFIRQFQENNSICICHSLGGIVGCITSSKFPEIFSKLIIIQSPLSNKFITPENIDLLHVLNRVPNQGPLPDLVDKVKDNDLFESIMFRIAERYAGPLLQQMNDSFGYNFINECIEELEIKGVIDFGNYLMNFNITKDVENIKIPVLGMYSSGDIVIDYKCGDFLVEHCPKAKISISPSFSHMSIILEPKNYIKDILKFLEPPTFWSKLKGFFHIH